MTQLPTDPRTSTGLPETSAGPGYWSGAAPGGDGSTGGTPPPPGGGFATPRRSPGRRITELAVVALVAAGLASGGTYVATRSTTTGSSSTIGQTSADGPVVQADPSAPNWTATAAAVSPSVVSITVSTGRGDAEGSGVLIDAKGHVVTNNHVVTGVGSGAKIQVVLQDGRSYDASIVGTDAATDLAVVAISNPPEDLRPITVGDSDRLAVGDPVMAVGNPLGLAGTVTSGIVSALNRPVSTGSGDSGFGGSSVEPVVTNAIQTSAAINPGNSGGALVTSDGKLIGINSSIATLGSSSSSQGGNIGIGFAIPSNEVVSIANQLIATGSAEHAYLGVSSSDGTADEGSATRAAAVVRSVQDGTPAASAGLQAGDAIVELDGQQIDSSLSLVAAIRERSVGETVTLTVVRNGSRQDISVSLGARPSS